MINLNVSYYTKTKHGKWFMRKEFAYSIQFYSKGLVSFGLNYKKLSMYDHFNPADVIMKIEESLH